MALCMALSLLLNLACMPSLLLLSMTTCET